MLLVSHPHKLQCIHNGVNLASLPFSSKYQVPSYKERKLNLVNSQLIAHVILHQKFEVYIEPFELPERVLQCLQIQGLR